MRRTVWILLGAIIGAAAVGAAVAVLQPDGEARVSLKRLEDGRSEVAIQLRRADGSWGGRILPDARFAGADAEPGRWLNSSPVALGGGPQALRLGLLDHFGGHGGITSVRAVQLAIKHVNAAGGVFGRPVEFAWRDTLEAPVFDQALALIDEEGVHAIIGPGTSSDALDIGRAIGAGRGIPLVTPSATSPAVAGIDDRGFVFRSVISDVAQGPILAQLARDRGYGHVAVAYRDDAWGVGLAESFFAAYEGRADKVLLDPADDSYIDELREAAAGGAPVLIAIAFTGQAIHVVGDALTSGTFDEFIFTDGSRSPRLLAAFPEALDGTMGTAPYGSNIAEEEGHWERDYLAEYGELETLPYVRETYDAAIALMLAAELADSTDGAAIRDALPRVGGPPGRRFPASSDGVAAALEAIRGGEEIDLAGEATNLDWDANGDVTGGLMSIWQFADGGIEELRVIPIDLSP